MGSRKRYGGSPSTGHSALYVLIPCLGFPKAGDFVRGHSLANLGYLLNKGSKVALVYGDRDYQCNWVGGEAISVAIESDITTDFKQAGYADIETNASYIGGFVRQVGNLSFSRVFQAGHEGKHWYHNHDPCSALTGPIF